MLLSFSVKHTGEESGGELCEIFKFRSFLQSKSVNNVCKLLHQTQTLLLGLRPWTPLGDFRPHVPLAIAPQTKIYGAATEPT